MLDRGLLSFDLITDATLIYRGRQRVKATYRLSVEHFNVLDRDFR